MHRFRNCIALSETNQVIYTLQTQNTQANRLHSFDKAFEGMADISSLYGLAIHIRIGKCGLRNARDRRN